ncbi:MAG: caspase family protein [Saprospiraceae bacterium]
MKIFKNKVFGNYTTLDYLGKGSFTSVYTAVHNFTKEKVALKIAHTNDKTIIAEFNKIVKSGLKGLLKIDHKDIIGIREYFVVSEGNTEYFILVLDLVKGDSLDRTNVVDTCSLQEKLAMFGKICDAIIYAHEFEYEDQNEYHSYRIKGIFHGDIKPNNIMISQEMDPKIIDFSFLNLKKAAGESENFISEKEVNTGEFGTKGYMPPEQEDFGIINEKTDIYALGIVLKQLIYGFKFEKVAENKPIFLKLDKIIEKATQTKPELRYESVRALKFEVDNLSKNKFRLSPWISIAASVLIVGVIGFFFYQKNLKSSTETYNSSSYHDNSEENQRGVKARDTTNFSVDLNKNKYYALLIGNNDYKHWKKLKYPVVDVDNMKNALLENYTFEPENIKVITNGTYETIYKGFESFTDHGPNTYLLIYYAGHGKYDNITDKTSLIPIDAEENSDSKNITSDIIKDLLKKCRIHNILFISDACYLGAMASRGLDKDSVERHDINTFKSFASKQSRKFISSGAQETVPDKSYFNEYLIKYLNTNPHDITFEYTLYNDIIEPIRRNSSTTPVFGVFFDTRDEGGHFFFVKRKK